MQYLNTSPPTGNEEDETGPKPVDERVVAHIPGLTDDELLETFKQYPYGPYTAELINRYLAEKETASSLDALLTKMIKLYPKVWDEIAP